MRQHVEFSMEIPDDLERRTAGDCLTKHMQPLSVMRENIFITR